MTIGPVGLQPKDLHVFLFATLLNLRNLTAQGLLLKATGEAVRTLWVWPNPGLFQRGFEAHLN